VAQSVNVRDDRAVIPDRVRLHGVATHGEDHHANAHHSTFLTRKPKIGHKLIEEFNEQNYHQPLDEYEDWDSHLVALAMSLCPPGRKAA
jgi:hypothetical protein